MKKSNKEKLDKSIFANLDKDLKRENQVYVNEEIMEAVLEAKRQNADDSDALDDSIEISPVFSTLRDGNPAAETNNEEFKESIDANTNNEPHPDDLTIYDSLFSETTIVSTQIYTYEIDKNLGEDSFTSSIAYRVGQDVSDIGTIFTITRKTLSSPISVKRPHSGSDISWYNDLAALGFSYAAVCGTTVQGIIICEPQYWNNTLYIRHLMVEKNMRRKGIGKQLIQECEHRAKTEGFRALVLEVQSLNGAAIDFYKSLGFTIVGANTALYSNSDIFKDDVAIFMHKIIV